MPWSAIFQIYYADNRFTHICSIFMPCNHYIQLPISDKQDCYCSLSSKTLAALLHKKVIQEWAVTKDSSHRLKNAVFSDYIKHAIMCSCECVWLPVLLSVNIIYFFHKWKKKMKPVKKQTCKKKLSQRDLKNHHWYGMASHLSNPFSWLLPDWSTP